MPHSYRWIRGSGPERPWTWPASGAVRPSWRSPTWSRSPSLEDHHWKGQVDDYFLEWANPGLFLFICVLFKQKFNRKTVGVSGIRTRIIGVEGEKADHLTTTTAKSMIIANRNLMIGWQGNIYHEQNVVSGAVIVAQLVEQSLPTPEVRGSNLVISYFYVEHMFTVNCYHIFSENFKKLWSHWLWAIL